MHTNDLSYIKDQLGRIRPSEWATVSEKSGVPLGTLRKIAYEEVEDPRFMTVKKLADYFRSANKKSLKTKAVAEKRDGPVTRRKSERRQVIGRREADKPK